MKKIAELLTAAISAVTVLCSCMPDERAVLWYQKYPLTAEIEAEDGTLEITVGSDGSVTATVMKPDGIAGVCFVFGERDMITAGDMEIPISRESADRVLALAGAFALDESSITSVDAEGGETAVTFAAEGGSYIVTYDSDGAPTGFVYKSGDREISAKINKITPSPDGSDTGKKDVNSENTEKQGVG